MSEAMPRDYNNTSHGKTLYSLGYNLHMWHKDYMGNKRLFCVSGRSGGSRSFFDSLDDLNHYIRQVKMNRAMEEMGDEEFRNYSRGIITSPLSERRSLYSVVLK